MIRKIKKPFQPGDRVRYIKQTPTDKFEMELTVTAANKELVTGRMTKLSPNSGYLLGGIGAGFGTKYFELIPPLTEQ